MAYFRAAVREDGTPEDRPVGLGGAAMLAPWGGEEGRLGVAPDLVDEDAGEGALGKVAREKEEIVGVDHGAPRAADAPASGEGAAGEAAEDVEEHVVGKTDAVAGVTVVCGIHRGEFVMIDR